VLCNYKRFRAFKKINIVVFFWGLVFFMTSGRAGECETTVNHERLLSLRPFIQQYIDKLRSFDVISIGHSTDLLQVVSAKRRMPKAPTAFDAGRFEVQFSKGDDVESIILQTESKVGHYATVIPGVTVIDGYVELDANSKETQINWQQLSRDEIDYFIRMLYFKFSEPLNDEEAQNIDALKDIALAIFFNGREGIAAYHKKLGEQLK
jgi:hypothetical protein